MNTAPRARAFCGPLRTTALVFAALMSGAALLLAGCSGSSAPTAASAPAHGAVRVHAKKRARKTTRRRGFVAGFTAGWHGLRLIGSGILIALGAALPFAVPLAVLAAAGYAGRRHLRRLLHWPRRGTRPTAAG